MKRNRLKSNLEKSKVVIFANNVPEKMNFGYLGKTIKTNLSFLGVVLDDKFSFKDHMRKLQRKISCCN